MRGPNSPLARAFEMSGWHIPTVVLLSGKEHDLSKPDNQEAIRRYLKQADFTWAAIDRSGKARVGEIPRKHADGKVIPLPLRSEEFPMGVPELQGHDRVGVAASKTASELIPGELRLHQSKGGCSGRQNPASNLRWYTPTEIGRFKQGAWRDKVYDACTLQGAGRKKQCIHHDVEEIRLWPDTRCRHLHHPQELALQVNKDGRTWYPSEEEAEHTAWSVLHVIYSASTWACRVRGVKLAIPRRPPVEYTGDRREWLQPDARALRGWSNDPRGSRHKT
jgi:hypothetical protein